MNLLEVSLEKLFSVLGTDPENGLSEDQAARNRREFGENVLFEKKNSVSSILKRIFGDVMMIVLLVTSLIDFIASRRAAPFVSILVVVLSYFAFSLGSWAYLERVRKKVDRVCRNKYRVRRDGRIHSIHKSEIAAGDLLLLEKGDVMPCDGIILRQKGLRILEAGVTGRRVPVFKRSHAEVQNGDAYPYFECILFAGSVILQGSVQIFVCNVGKEIFDRENFTISRQNTTLPQICRTALYLKKQISMVWVLGCFLLFAWGVFCGVSVFDIFYFSVALAIAALPETIESMCDLAVSYMTEKLFQEGAVLRNPGAIDLLGDVNCVFLHSSDFLYYSQPMADRFFSGDQEYDFKETPKKAEKILENLLLTQPGKGAQGALSGKEKQAERAVLRAAASIGMQMRSLRQSFMPVNSYDYDPRYGYAAALLLKENRYRLAVRGDPDPILNASTMIERDGVTTLMKEGDRVRLRSLYKSMTSSCEKIYTVAYRTLSSPSTGDQRENVHDLIFLGFFGLSTPLSASAAKAVSTCQKSGIRTFLLTDDYPETVGTIAHSVSVIGPEDYPYALDYRSYQRMDRGVFIADIDKYKAFSSFPAEEKQSVIRYHKENGDLVAALSGGLYDSLPQMECDVSFVSTEERYQCTKLNSDILLKEKRFDLVPLCINWARTFYRNIVHIMQYSLVLQAALFLCVFIGLASGGNTVFSVLQLITLSVGAFLPSMFNLFHRKPGMKLEDNEGVLSKDRVYSWQALLVIPAVIGAASALCVMMSYRIALFGTSSADAASNAALFTFAFSSFFTSLSMKFDDYLFRNFKLIGKTEAASLSAVLFTVLLLIFSPFARLYHDSYAEAGSGLSFGILISAFLLSLVPFGISELMKWIKAVGVNGAEKEKPVQEEKKPEKEEEEFDGIYDDEHEEEDAEDEAP